MNAIVLMLDALGDAPERAVKAAQSQGYPFYRFIEDPKPKKVKGTLKRIEAITKSRNRSREWIRYYHPTSDFIALVDSDVVLPPDAVRMMLRAPKMIVGGWVPVRGVKNRWIAATTMPDGSFINYRAPENKIVETIMLPLAACVMPRGLYDTIEVRAPKHPYESVICGYTGERLYPSEPYLFTRDLNEIYHAKAWMHPDVICEHISENQS